MCLLTPSPRGLDEVGKIDQPPQTAVQPTYVNDRRLVDMCDLVDSQVTSPLIEPLEITIIRGLMVRRRLPVVQCRGDHPVPRR